jgi:ubiquinone/menaquinone biosynthesis C-methylase UbiE
LKETRNPIVATDFSPTILRRNKEYYKTKGLYDRLSLIAFDARKTPFRDNSIAIMTSNMGLPNIEQAGEVTKELNRIIQNEFMSVMLFIDKEDKVHIDLMKQYGMGDYVTRDNAIETFEKSNWKVEICNPFLADIKPTPKGQIVEGAGIDGFPIEDTKVEFCVIRAVKEQ